MDTINSKNTNRLNKHILMGVLAGVLSGVFLNYSGLGGDEYWLIQLCSTVGGVFIGMLKMILIPLVFSSIAVGIANLREHHQMGRIWKTALLYFMSTTALAVTTGLIVVNIFGPGKGVTVDLLSRAESTDLMIQRMSVGDFAQSFIKGLFVNPIHAMANNNILPTVVFAIFLGIAMIIKKDETKTLNNLLNEFFKVCMTIVNWIMLLAPIGIAALLTKMVASQDVGFLKTLGVFIFVVLFGTFFHGFFSLPILLKFFSGLNPFVFFKEMRQAFVTAFATSSSSATLPVTMQCVEKGLKVDKDVAGFVLPLGATINMDGTALYEAVAALFIANIVGIELNLIQQLIVFFTSIVAAIGAPGIPSAGMVTMAMVLQSVGLPVEAIAILLPIDRLLDAFRTTVNVEGDSVGSVIINHHLGGKSSAQV